MIVKDSAKLKQESQQLIVNDKRQWQQEQVKLQKARDAETLGLDAGRDRLDLEAQIGRPLRRLELVRKIRTLVPSIYYEQSKAMASRGGLYKNGKFLMGMEHGISPEFSVMEQAGGHGRVLMKGWRTILAQLIQGGYITVVQAEDTFGILRGAQSERWWKLAL
jgi:hypothetical protein